MKALPETIIKESHFFKRGSAYFRMQGEGILQVIKFEKSRTGVSNLNIGLFSMYSELLPQWFTAQGCIPRYPIIDLISRNAVHQPILEKDRSCYFASQIEILLSDGIPWLDAIDTHKKMLDALFMLELNRYGKVRWCDELKFSPLLICQDFPSAERVISSILENHRIARKMNRTLFTTADDYQRYVGQRQKEDEQYEYLLKMVQQRDQNQINQYLDRNNTRNNRLAKFCIPKNLPTH